MSTASVPCTQRPAFKSLLVSTGKGHVEYTEEDYNLDPEEVTAFRERKESFQLQVWGHHNTDHHRPKKVSVLLYQYYFISTQVATVGGS